MKPDEPIPTRVIQCFGRVVLTRLPYSHEPQGTPVATIQLGDPFGKVGLLYLTDYKLNQIFDVEITLNPISEQERQEISHSRPVML